MKIRVENLKDAGIAMRKTRKSQGFTQKEFAMQLGISHFLARDIEQGKPSVKVGNFFKYAEELGIEFSMDAPFSETESINRSKKSKGN